MGGKMIKNLIIISLLILLLTGMTGQEFLDYMALGLDKAQEIVYNIKSEVK
jgi:hypothetical protein